MGFERRRDHMRKTMIALAAAFAVVSEVGAILESVVELDRISRLCETTIFRDFLLSLPGIKRIRCRSLPTRPDKMRLNGTCIGKAPTDTFEQEQTE
jgi:hypothetical protein